MKKLLLLFFGILAFCSVFQACSNSKTYAEMLEDERKATRKFISNHNIKKISVEDFEKDTTTNVTDNEYVEFSNGVYLQIIKRGDGDSIVTRDVVTVRMKEYNIMGEINSSFAEDTLSNIDYPYQVDNFIYNPNVTSISFNTKGTYFPIYGYQQSIDVPQGIIYVIPYLRENAEIKLIVPSKKGHSVAMQYVYPYYYHIHKLGLSYR